LRINALDWRALQGGINSMDGLLQVSLILYELVHLDLVDELQVGLLLAAGLLLALADQLHEALFELAAVVLVLNLHFLRRLFLWGL